MAVAGQGFLSVVSEKIREYIDEPGTSTKFSDARILDMMRRAFADIIDDVNRASLEKIRARVDVTVVADRREYALPPYMGQFLEFKKLSDDGDIEWEEIARHPLSPWGPGFTIEGPLLRLDPVWKTGYTMRIDYVPTGAAKIFETGTAQATTVTASTIKPGSAVDAGAVDKHKNAYLGYIVRVLSDGTGTDQERVVSSEDRTTQAQPIFTVKPDFDPTPTSTVLFEMLPAYAYRFEDLVALRVARFIAGVTGDRDRWEALNLEYQDSLAKLKLRKSQAEGRRGHKLTRVVRGRRGRWGKTV